MHSRIFQVSMEPIHKGEYISESDYYDHWFTNTWADYVSDDCNREDDIKWLAECAKGYVVNKDAHGDYLIVYNKEDYFADAFETFKEELIKIGCPTLTEFASGIDLYRLNSSYEEKCGFYVDVDGELMTFDAFVRGCAQGEQCYIGGTVDYHF